MSGSDKEWQEGFDSGKEEAEALEAWKLNIIYDWLEEVWKEEESFKDTPFGNLHSTYFSGYSRALKDVFELFTGGYRPEEKNGTGEGKGKWRMTIGESGTIIPKGLS